MTFAGKILRACLFLPLTLLLADGAAAAKKKLTYDEAYAKCKSIMDKEGTPGTSTQANVRHTRGAACMKKYGHKL